MLLKMATAKIRFKSAEPGKIAETVESFGAGFVVFMSVARIDLRLFALLEAVGGLAFMLIIATLLFVIAGLVLVATVAFAIVVVTAGGLVFVAFVLLFVAVSFVLVVVGRLMLLAIITHFVRCLYRNLFRHLDRNLGAMLFGNIVAIHFRHLNWMFRRYVFAALPRMF